MVSWLLFPSPPISDMTSVLIFLLHQFSKESHITPCQINFTTSPPLTWIAAAGPLVSPTSPPPPLWHIFCFFIPPTLQFLLPRLNLQLNFLRKRERERTIKVTNEVERRRFNRALIDGEESAIIASARLGRHTWWAGWTAVIEPTGHLVVRLVSFSSLVKCKGCTMPHEQILHHAQAMREPCKVGWIAIKFSDHVSFPPCSTGTEGGRQNGRFYSNSPHLAWLSQALTILHEQQQNDFIRAGFISIPGISIQIQAALHTTSILMFQKAHENNFHTHLLQYKPRVRTAHHVYSQLAFSDWEKLIDETCSSPSDRAFLAGYFIVS